MSAGDLGAMQDQNMSQDTNGFESNIPQRRGLGRVWRLVFQASTIAGIVVLTALLFNILNSSLGLAAVEFEIEPAMLAIEGVPLEQLTHDQLVGILAANVSKGLFRRYESEMPWSERSRDEVYDLVLERVVEPKVAKTWSLYDSLLYRDEIEREAAAKYPAATLQFFTSITPAFIQWPN